jgi:hypothetical protein
MLQCESDLKDEELSSYQGGNFLSLICFVELLGCLLIVLIISST